MAKLFEKLASLFGFGRLIDNSAATMRVGYMDPASEQAARLAKYDRNWQLYNGDTSASSASVRTNDEANLAVTKITEMGLKKEDGSGDLPKTNWLKRNIDKMNWWAFGRPYTVNNEDYQEILDATENCWGPHLIEKLENMGQYGSVCGDAFVMVLPRQGTNKVQFDPQDFEFKAEVASDVNVAVLNPTFCSPVYDPFDRFRLKAMDITIPMRVIDESGAWTTHFQFQRITPEKVYTAILDKAGAPMEGTQQEYDNPVGEVYVLHIRNKPFGDATFGDDDLREAARLNEVYNEKLMSTGQVIDYHGAPITLIYGARAKNLSKGPNKVWGNLPKDGKVETLSLDSDLPANNEYLRQVKENIHVMMGVPEIAQGVQQAISNTSGVALHTMYMPLIERVVEKWAFYSPHIIHVHTLCVKWLEHLDLLKKDGSRGRKVNISTKKLTPEDYDRMLNDTEILWELPLPKDRLIEAQIQETLVRAHLRSKKGAMRLLGDNNPEKTQQEIEEESKKDIELAREKFSAEQGARQKNAVDNEGNTDDDPDGGSTPASGAEAGTGENTSDSEAQRGRPRGTGNAA